MGTYENEKQRLDNLALFGEKIKKAEKDKLKKLKADADKFAQEKEDTINNAIYNNAFEWRFEFPEVLDDKGNYLGFDAIIGNPPYIFSRELITEKDKIHFYKVYQLTQFKLNTYVLFTELAYLISNESSSMSYIIPNNWLTLQNNSDFREYLLNNSNNIVIVNDKNKTFEDANVDASIFIVSKKGVSSLQAFELINKDLSYVSNVDKKTYLNSSGSVINYQFNSNPDLANIINKINDNSFELSNYFDVKNGIQAYTVGEGKPKLTKEMKNERVYHSNEKKSEDWITYIDGSDVKRYSYSWGGLYVLYGKNLSRPRTPDLFIGERIFVRQIPSKPPYAIISTLISEKAVCDNNYMIIKSTENSVYSLNKLIGVLNSKLISFWFSATFAKDQRKLFPQFKVNELKTFPIPKIDSTLLFEIENNVNKVSLFKQDNPEADTTTLEKEIDAMVYALYGLTEEEIKIVEES